MPSERCEAAGVVTSRNGKWRLSCKRLRSMLVDMDGLDRPLPLILEDVDVILA